MLEHVHQAKTPKQIWDKLNRIFERSSVARRMHLQCELLMLKFDGSSLQDHFLNFDRLVRELRATEANVDELDTNCYLFSTLGTAFSMVVTTLESMPKKDLSLEFVKRRLLNEEVKQKDLGVEPVAASKALNRDTAAFSGSSQVKKKLKYWACKQEGHKADV